MRADFAAHLPELRFACSQPTVNSQPHREMIGKKHGEVILPGFLRLKRTGPAGTVQIAQSLQPDHVAEKSLELDYAGFIELKSIAVQTR